MRYINPLPFVLFFVLLLSACNSSGGTTPAKSAASSRAKPVSVLTNPKALVTSPSGHNAASLANLGEAEKKIWFAEGVTKSWQRECQGPKISEIPTGDQGVLSFVQGTKGMWKVQCSGGDKYFALLPINPADKLQFVLCEGEVSKGNLCKDI